MKFTLTNNSIKNRLLAIIISCSIVLIVCAIVAQIFVARLSSQSADNIRLRQNIIEHSRAIRSSLSVATDVLTFHLLSPREDILESWREQENEIASRIASLKQEPWLLENRLIYLVSEFERYFTHYTTEIEQLIYIRLDASKQHPSLYYARETMLPLNRNFLTNASLALEEIVENGIEDPVNATAYREIIQARYLWQQIISNFRMYIINRLGSFDTRMLDVQRKDIETFYQQLNNQLQEMQSKIENGGMAYGFQTEASITEMSRNLNQWFKDFNIVRAINDSPNWRMDVVIMEDTIQPLDNKLLFTLKKLELHVAESATDDVDALATMGQNIIIAIWLLLITGGIVTAIGFTQLSRLVLKPIALLTKALKAEATDSQHVVLPDIKSEETQNLIDAFSIMRKQVHTRQAALEHQAMHDALTGLPNRNLLHDRVQQFINQMHREDGIMILMMMDLNHFKEINDTLGHQIGDRILEQVALRLVNTLRDTDTVARLGGDEFAMALPIQERDHANIVARKILKSLEKPFQVEGYQLFVGGSIGISFYPEHGDSVDTLLQRSDVAMYVAKRSNLGFTIYDPSFDKDSMGRLALSNDLRIAIDQEQLEVYYQPKLSLKSGMPSGVEALIRWNHPERGFISPEEIIYIAEHTGLIKPLTRWVIKQAISQCSDWHTRGWDLSVAINLSTQNLQDSSLFQVIESILNSYQFPPEHLILEVTESAMMLEPEHASKILRRLDAIGVWISIDDFGTGFSSLAYLKQLPVDELKVDKSFVMNMQDNENDAVIVRSIIDLARNLGLKVVAEGVENEGVWELLCILGCDFAQGYYMGRPLDADSFEDWMQHHHKLKVVNV